MLPAWAPALALVAITFAAYFRILGHGFVWNDPDYVTHPALQNWDGLWRIWFVVGSTEQHYPLLHSLFWLQHHLWGDAPLGYHLVSVLTHAGSCVLLAAIVRRLGLPGAWLAGAIFALHPVAVESVAWVSEQKNTFSTLLYLAAGWAYLRFDDSRRPRDFAFASLLYVLALLTKSLTATLPPTLLVIAWWRRGRLDWRRDVRPLWSWFVAGAAIGLFSAWVEHYVVGAAGAEYQQTGLERVLIASRAIWFYLGHVLWPVGLMFIYPRWHVDPTAIWQWIFPLLTLGTTVALWLWRRRNRAPLAVWLLFVGNLFPVMGFFNLYAFRYSFVADHWQYLPSLSLFAAAAVMLSQAFTRLPRFRLGLLATLLVTLAVLSGRLMPIYRDSITFYRGLIASNPGCWMAYLNLGSFYLYHGNTHSALAINTAQQARENYVTGHENAEAREAAQFYTAAIACFEKALELNPQLTEAHNNLAIALQRVGNIAGALEHYQKAIALRRDYDSPHLNLAYLLTRFGQPAGAISELHEALRANPFSAEAYCALGDAWVALGQPERALADYEAALRYDPEFRSAHINLGNALLHLRRPAEADTHYEIVLKQDPTDWETQVNHAAALVQLGRLEEAVAVYDRVLQARPDIPEAHNNYGCLLLDLGHPAEAAARFQQALALRPGYPDAQRNLARAETALADAAR